MKKLLAVFGVAAVQMFAQSNTPAPSNTPAQSNTSSQTTTPASAANANPLSGATRYMWNHSKDYLLKSAEEMPEENYSFKPVASVRSFGQIIGHVADAQYEFCSGVVGDGKQSPGIEKSKTSKADLIQALKDAFAYCDPAYSNMTDTRGAETVKFFNHDAPKLSLLNFNLNHNAEHYGNLVTYLRIKGLVPPSSQGSMQ